MLKKIGLTLDLIVRIAVHATVLVLAVCLFYPEKLKVPPRMTQALWGGHDRAYVIPGSQFKIFKPYLHKGDRVSLILDRPITATIQDKQTARDAQNYLVPHIINFETVEPVALVYCSTQAIADQRLAETGYEWKTRIAAGKGLCQKKS